VAFGHGFEDFADGDLDGVKVFERRGDLSRAKS